MESTEVLVVEDQPAVRAALVYPLSLAYHTREACSVACALRALREESPVVVVLDLHLDVPAAALHEALAARGVPVVLISGLDADDARAIAARRGWACLSKPTSDPDLLAAVAAALEASTPMTDHTLAPRPSIVPDLPPPPRAAEPAPTTTHSDAPLHPHPEVAIVDLRTRRWLRGGCALAIFVLTVVGQVTGHEPSGIALGLIGVMGAGAEAIAAAVKKRPGASAVGAATLVGLAVAGEVVDVTGLGAMAATGLAAATALVDRARGA